MFEGGIGVPFIARWPGVIEAGKIDDTSLISAVDLLPTFCEVAGAKPPADYMPDGVSVVEVLKGQPMPQRERPLFWKIDAPWPAKGKPDHWVAWAVVHDRWKLAANRDLSHTELYDIAADVGESADVKAAHTEVAEDLLTKLKEWQATLPVQPTGEVFSELRQETR